MPYLRSNISSKIFYFGNRSKILKNARATHSKLIFSNNIKKLATRICKEGGRIKTFPHTFAKHFGRHFRINSFDEISDFRVAKCWYHETCLMSQSGQNS